MNQLGFIQKNGHFPQSRHPQGVSYKLHCKSGRFQNAFDSQTTLWQINLKINILKRALNGGEKKGPASKAILDYSMFWWIKIILLLNEINDFKTCISSSAFSLSQGCTTIGHQRSSYTILHTEKQYKNDYMPELHFRAHFFNSKNIQINC